MEKPSMIKPALIGGVVLGLLSILPFIKGLCCLWAIVGGVIAAWIYIKNSPLKITSGNGAGVGALSGFVGGVIFIVGFVLSTAKEFADPEIIAEQFKGYPIDPNVLKFFTEHFILVLFLYSIIFLVTIVALSTLGGIIGVAIFEKRKGAMAQPPPYPYAQPPGAPQPPYPPYPPAGPGPVNPPPPPQEPPQPPPQAYDKPEGPPEGQS
jgi:hypothetical protein